MNYDWFQILGGDGFHAIPDLRDSRIVYTESQNGNMIRRNKVTGESKSIRPTALNVVNAGAGRGVSLPLGHADDALAARPGRADGGGQPVFRLARPRRLVDVISPDLTQNANRDTIVTMGVQGKRHHASPRNDGISQWPAIVALAESPAGGRALHRHR
jgi:hypothetical protein